MDKDNFGIVWFSLFLKFQVSLLLTHPHPHPHPHFNNQIRCYTIQGIEWIQLPAGFWQAMYVYSILFQS